MLRRELKKRRLRKDCAFVHEKPRATDIQEKRTKKDQDSEVTVKQLEAMVFGGEDEFFADLKSDERSSLTKNEAYESDDSSDNEPPEEMSAKPSTSATESTRKDYSKLKPAWVDEDDEKEMLSAAHKKLKPTKQTWSRQKTASDLKESFEKIQGTLGTPAWAEIRRKKHADSTSGESDSEEGDVSDLAKRTGKFIGKSPYLPKGTLQFKRLKDITFGHRKRKPISVVEFSQEARVALVASQAQTLAIYEIDGDKNPLLQSLQLDRFPVDMAHFSADGTKVFAGSHLHSYFWCYDLLKGKSLKIPDVKGMEQTRTDKFSVSPDGTLLAFQGRFGYIQLLTAKVAQNYSYEWIGSLKMNGEVSALSFSAAQPNTLYSFGEEGQVYIWDLGEKRCSHRFFDEGCIRGTSMSLSDDGLKLATGSNTGVVNMYDALEVEKKTEPQPVKSFMNLTTAVDTVTFAKNAEILGVASSLKENAVRMVHVGSKSVFNNFPGRRGKMKAVKCLDFSLNTGFMLAGSEEGRAMLFRLQHYHSY